MHVRRGVHRDEARERQRAQRQEPAAADTHAPEHGEERGPPEKGREREKVAELRDVHRELVVRLVAERELAAGRLVAPLAERAANIRYVGHRLVFPRAPRQHAAVRAFADWIKSELRVSA